MSNQKSLGIYVHVPFCRSKCAYCDFYSLSGADGLMDPFVDALAAQVRAAPRPRPADTVYFGGGTPSFLGPRRLAALLRAVTRRFPVLPGAEITLEANPDSVGPWFADLRAAGFNRVSLGMQSAHDASLRLLGRVHSARQTRDAVRAVRRAGFRNLSLDLMYGLPGQSLAAWLDSVKQAVDLGPDHLSCYALKLEPHTPLCALSVPGDDLQADMYLSAVDLLSRRGYRQYEISNFARPGRESRHNLKYWTLGEYVGFGPGAHSDFGGVRFAWARDLAAFVGGAWTLSERVEVTERERAREWLMLGLRTVDGLDAAKFAYDFSAFDAFFDACAAAGYARRAPGRVSLTPEGFLVSNAIIGRVLELFDEIPKKRTCVPAPDSI